MTVNTRRCVMIVHGHKRADVIYWTDKVQRLGIDEQLLSRKCSKGFNTNVLSLPKRALHILYGILSVVSAVDSFINTRNRKMHLVQRLKPSVL